ncbi:SPFH domain-containing protein [Mycoplasma sp. CB776]
MIYIIISVIVAVIVIGAGVWFFLKKKKEKEAQRKKAAFERKKSELKTKIETLKSPDKENNLAKLNSMQVENNTIKDLETFSTEIDNLIAKMLLEEKERQERERQKRRIDLAENEFTVIENKNTKIITQFLKTPGTYYWEEDEQIKTSLFENEGASKATFGLDETPMRFDINKLFTKDNKRLNIELVLMWKVLEPELFYRQKEAHKKKLEIGVKNSISDFIRSKNWEELSGINNQLKSNLLKEIESIVSNTGLEIVNLNNDINLDEDDVKALKEINTAEEKSKIKKLETEDEYYRLKRLAEAERDYIEIIKSANISEEVLVWKAIDKLSDLIKSKNTNTLVVSPNLKETALEIVKGETSVNKK